LRVRTAEGSDESYGGGAMTFRSAEGGAWVARACSQRRRCGAWTGGWFQHWCGWLSLGEALQIQW